MTKLYLLIALISFQIFASAQVITGVVLDTKTNSAVSYATVYFSGTFVGTITNSSGDFHLDVTKIEQMPLTVSAVGCHTVKINNYTVGKPLVIRMNPLDFKLDEVTVLSNSLVKKRKTNLRLFKETFLGTTDNGIKCKILNEEDITFNYDSDKDTLKAFASKPIQIENSALGYKITYYLERFEFYYKTATFLYEGDFIFSEDINDSHLNQEAINENRKEVYLGSIMHFFRTLWDNQLDTEWFVVTSAVGENIGYTKLVAQEIILGPDSVNRFKKYLVYHPGLTISYDGSSKADFLKPKVYFNKSGYFDGGLLWSGEMISKRVGDMLPYEYSIVDIR